MTFSFKKSALALGILATGLVSAAAQADDPGTSNGEWHHYTGDIKGSRYSALDQINAENFEDLELAWSFSTKNLRNYLRFGAKKINQIQMEKLKISVTLDFLHKMWKKQLTKLVLSFRVLTYHETKMKFIPFGIMILLCP